MEFLEHRSVLEPFFAIPLANAPGPVKAAIRPVLDLQRVLWREQIQITFFGGFKAGKSTLLNAIMGWSLLPSRANRATGVITRVLYAPQASASVIRRAADGTLAEEHILLDEIGRYVFLDLSGTIARAPEGVEEVLIRIPLPLLKLPCLLADTPGLMDTAALTERCYQELERSDLAVMVLSAIKFFSEEERAAAGRVQELLKGNLVFVVNRLDMVDEEDREETLAWARASLEGYCSPLIGCPAVFATEARGALEARKSGQSQDDAVLGLHAFEQWLEALLQSPAAQQMVARARLGSLHYALSRARAVLHAQLTDAEQAAAELERQETAALAQRQGQFKREMAEVVEALDLFKAHLWRLGEDFLRDCVQGAQDLILSDERWSAKEKLRLCFEAALVTYAGKVNKRVSVETEELPLQLPVFTPGVRGSIGPGIVRDPTAKLALGAGMTLNSWLEGDPLGDMFAGWLTKALFTNDAKQKVLAAVEQGALEVLVALRQEAEAYLEEIKSRVRGFAQTHLPALEPSVSLLSARKIETYYRSLVQWADEFQEAVDNLMQAYL
jgi:hypothetical protein